ncbi:PilZ domain-containing protein [Candidatus Nitrospira bockiana]
MELPEESRKFRRFAVQYPVTFVGDQAAGDGVVFNLSAQGCAVGSATPPAKGTYVSLAIVLDEADRIHIDLAAVRWATDSTFGLEFIKLDFPDQTRLRELAKALEA